MNSVTRKHACRFLPAGPLMLLICISTSCVSIPKQAPELSVELGKKVSSLESSHINLLRSYFEQRRERVDEFVESTWLPLFAENFFTNPQIKAAWDQIVQSKDPKERLDFLLFVGPQLLEVINEKRRELIAPLDELERDLEAAIRNDYNLARSMNNSLTSFLESAVKVKEDQQRYLDMIGVTDEKVSKAIDDADEVLEDLVSKADKIEDYTDKAESYKKKFKEIRDKIKK